MTEPLDDARGELLAFPRRWIEQARDQLMSMKQLPSGHVGDWIFLFREQLTDALNKPRTASVPQCEAEPVHDGPCFYCGEPTRGLAGDPGMWPLRFCQPDGTGITRFHHTRCVTERLAAPSRLDAGSVEARSHWAIEASIPEDGFECYYLLRDDITVAEICGHQTEQRGRHLDDLVFAANGNTPESKILASQAMEYARRLNDIALNCEIAAFEGDASDLRRIAEWLAALVPPPSEAGSAKAISDAIKGLTGLFSILRGRSYAKDHYSLEISHGLYNELRDVRDQLAAALSTDPGTVAK